MMSQIDQPTALEWVWRGLSLLAIPVLAWVLKLSGDLARADVERASYERRITQLENDARQDTKTLTEIKGLIIELKTQNVSMAEDITELKRRLRQ